MRGGPAAWAALANSAIIREVAFMSGDLAGAARGCKEGCMTNAAKGVAAEDAAVAALVAEGWTILGRRLRTPAGEVDVVAERDGLCVFVEVKRRPDFATAAWALGARQRARYMAAAEILLGANPLWGRGGVRFDVILVDAVGRVRRLANAFRLE
jgi:putative endonuclease